MLSFHPVDKDLKRILKDGKFGKLPTNANIIGKEIIRDNGKRFGYLIFKSDSNQIKKWITDSRFILTSTVEIFEKNIMVWPTNRPNWFSNPSNNVGTSDIYYAKREKDHFITLCIVNMVDGVIIIEYQIRD